MVIESFADCSSLGWYLWSHNVCTALEQDLLAFILSIEKSGVILIEIKTLSRTFLFRTASLHGVPHPARKSGWRVYVHSAWCLKPGTP